MRIRPRHRRQVRRYPTRTRTRTRTRTPTPTPTSTVPLPEPVPVPVSLPLPLTRYAEVLVAEGVDRPSDLADLEVRLSVMGLG